MAFRVSLFVLGFWVLSLSLASCQNLEEAIGIDTADVEPISKLPSKLKENSGVVKLNDGYWFLNDGGNKAALYEVGIDSGKILQTVVVEGVKNTDWEEMTWDSNYLYVGDIGNNSQKRKNLRIHKIRLESFNGKDTVRVEETLKYKYEDQKDFPPKKKRNFDCEAFLSFGDSIYLFTKNYSDKNTNIYALSKDSLKQKAEKIGSFESVARVTAAAKHPSERYFVLLAYQKKYSSPYIWVISNEGNLKNIHQFAKKYLKLPIRAQAEAITHYKEDQFIISAEKGGSISARTFLLDLKDDLIFN